MTRSENKEHISLFILLVGTLILFRNVIQFDFVWDDVFLIPKNPYLSQPIHILEIFSSGFWKFSSAGDNVMPYYRPVVTIFYILEYKIFGLYAGGYHFVNLILHLFNIVLVWNVSSKFGLERIGRLVCASIFAFHPAQVGTVCFISCHGDLLAMFFSLLAVYFWFFEKPVRWVSLIWILLAMLSKEAAVILPVIIICTDWFIRNKKNIGLKMFFPMLPWIVYFILRYYGLQQAEYKLEPTQPIWSTLGSFRTFLFIGRILFPIPIAPEVGVPPLAMYKKIFFNFIYFFLIVIVLIKTKTSPLIRFLFGWFFLTTILIADWFSFNLRFSDQLLYYPLLPISLLIGLFVQQKNKMLYIAVPILLVFAVVSGSQVKFWKNNVTFWANAFQKDRENPNYGLNYAAALQESGRKKEGCDLMLATLQIAEKKYHPVYVNLILYNLGNCNLDQNPFVAEKYYKKAIAVYENDSDSRKNLIIALVKQNKNQEAVDEARILTQKDPNDYESWFILSEALKASGNIDESRMVLEKYKSAN